MCEERSRLREARCNVALVWNRASEKDLIVSFAQADGMDPFLHNKSVFYETIDIQGEQFTRRIFLPFNSSRPKQDCDVDEQ
jgi:hypothetical protein